MFGCLRTRFFFVIPLWNTQKMKKSILYQISMACFIGSVVSNFIKPRLMEQPVPNEQLIRTMLGCLRTRFFVIPLWNTQKMEKYQCFYQFSMACLIISIVSNFIKPRLIEQTVLDQQLVRTIFGCLRTRFFVIAIWNNKKITIITLIIITNNSNNNNHNNNTKTTISIIT